MNLPLRSMSTFSPYALRSAIGEWEPSEKPHCANCSHARVGSTSEEPLVACQQGHGKVLPLLTMIRRKAPRQFRPASACPDWDSMGPPCNVMKP